MDVDAVLAELAVDDLASRLALVDERIAEILHVDLEALESATRRVADSGGKRLRPAFAIACAQLGGVFGEGVIAGAAATELVQVGSLVHDDIFEQSASRRSVPTINAVEGPELALLAGDFILARAAEEAARSGQRQAQVLAHTLVELCEGQVAEMSDLGDVDRSVEHYFRSIAGKTAALFEAACRIGALCAGLPSPVVESVATFGHEFGLAFQLLDDVLDLVGSPMRLRKPVGVDIPAGVYTYPVLCALDSDRTGRLRRLLERRNPEDLVASAELVRRSTGIPRALEQMEEHVHTAQLAIDSLIDVPARGLADFAGTYFDWALGYFRAGTSASSAS